MSAAAPAFPRANLLWELTRGEIRARDQGTALGLLWTLAQPALLFAVLYGLFVRWMGVLVPDYAAYLLAGLLVWNLFQRSVAAGLSSLRRRASLVRNYDFPRELLVLSAMGPALLAAAGEGLILLVYLSVAGRGPCWAWLWALPALLGVAGWAAGAGMALAALHARYRDVDRAWEVAASLLFYLTPVFYPLSAVSAEVRAVLSWNPLAQALSAARAALVDGRAPDALPLAALAASGLAAAALGLWILRRARARLLELLLR